MSKLNPFSMRISLISTAEPPQVQQEPAFWFIVYEDKLVVEDKNRSPRIPIYQNLMGFGLQFNHQRHIGVYKGKDCYVVELHKRSLLPDTLKPIGLRKLFGQLDDDLFTIAGRATQILYWDITHRFCGRCGSKMHDKPQELAKECSKCELICYPRISPAVIMAVRRDHEILLARSAHHRKGMYTTLAGFVEPGETLEDAVIREVKEEVNIKVRDISYFASQPWPFPHSLMIGFTAQFAAGKIHPDSSEIEDAQWFSANNLPDIPSRMTIARSLIDDFLMKKHS